MSHGPWNRKWIRNFTNCTWCGWVHPGHCDSFIAPFQCKHQSCYTMLYPSHHFLWCKYKCPSATSSMFHSAKQRHSWKYLTSSSGWWLQPLWKIWKSDWIIIPTLGENIKFMFQTTNQIIFGGTLVRFSPYLQGNLAMVSGVDVSVSTQPSGPSSSFTGTTSGDRSEMKKVRPCHRAPKALPGDFSIFSRAKKGMFDVLPIKKYGVSICVFRKRCGDSGVYRFHFFNICYPHSFSWENGNGGYNRISCDIPEDIEAIQYLGTTGFGVSHFHTNLVLGWRNKNGKSTPAISSELIPSPRNLMRVQSEEPALISDIHWRFEISQNMDQAWCRTKEPKEPSVKNDWWFSPGKSVTSHNLLGKQPRKNEALHGISCTSVTVEVPSIVKVKIERHQMKLGVNP